LKVMELVFSSLAWGWICATWGTTVDEILCNNLNLHDILRHLHPNLHISWL